MKILCLMLLCSALSCGAAAAAAPEQPSGCGFVSSSSKPPLSDDIYPADIRRINGNDTPKRALNRHRLPVGTHALAIQEQIGSVPRGYTALRKLGNREVPLVYKIIKVKVEAGRSYHIGAKLHREQLKPNGDSAYWTPVVWQSRDEACD